MPINLATGSKKHPLTERGADLYETPKPAIHALLKVEVVPQCVWEPAAGPGAIVETLRATGRRVIATDLHDWGCPESLAGADFLRQRQLPDGVEAIITNPPYKLAADFVRHALALCPKVIMLMRLAFIESVGRSDILDSGMLARIYPFANRLPMMHRWHWDGPKASSAMCFAWFVFEADHHGSTLLRRLRWEANTSAEGVIQPEPVQARSPVP
jgi:hypothetical protein